MAKDRTKKAISPDESPVNMLFLMVIFILILLLGIFYASAMSEDTSDSDAAFDADQTQEIIWSFTDEGDLLSFPLDLRGGREVTISAVLPDDVDDTQSLIVEAEYMYLEIRVAGETIYSTGMYDNGHFATAAGNNVAIVSLMEEYSGCAIEITIAGQSGNPDASLTEIFIQNRADYILEVTEENFLCICLGIFCCVLGVLIALVWIFRVMKRTLTNKKVNADYLYMSILLSAFGLWLLTNQNVSGVVSGTSAARGLIYYVAFSMIAVSVMGVSFYLYDAKSVSTEAALLIVQGNVVVQFLFFFAGIFDFTQMKTVSEWMNIFSIAAFVFLTFREMYRHRDDNFALNLLTGLPAGAALLAALICVVRDRNTNFCLILATGVIVGNILFRFISATFHMMQDGVMFKRVEERAYTDALTGLGNRRAYSEALDRIRSTPNHRNLIIAEFDVNGLKETNDDYGHAVGDELLIAVSDCLRKSFSMIGQCYRIGGDEFCVLASCDREEFEQAEKAYQRRMYECAEGFVRPPSASYGFACQCEHPDLSIDDLRQLVDAQMYAAKERYYTMYGNDRRKARQDKTDEALADEAAAIERFRHAGNQ